ncbi:outer membrane receptor for ferric coprogen and ferric-rhodotorulic acid [Povalibacter uvarum]|uniref:Outer membrane receptor for ferric coprogen and ferric-rhodotorulic acid n=1 Tax=Povalibacter uvarum TaxID=732238 RepID=A0A841HKC1_9GAMM|nr:TonB-dependent siderophore receptor [Povalibacter uvarum]MBB6092750.1 outer membrane receptor for ferric coprogen and ferric-rhodotorulic acid [Povalibacter uvarum]
MRSRLMGSVAALAVAGVAIPAQGLLAADDNVLEAVLVTAKRADRVSKGATGLDLDIVETPQSISVVTADQMERFGADNINDALRLATGINVEEWETNRTNYMSRGFEIKNTQIDGIGLPNDWGIVTGAIDSFGYEKIEVIRGANGLLTGVGNSAGTINYVRKRPTNDTQGGVSATIGSWDTRRIEADYSTPFTESGSWAGRIVAAAEEGDSWLRGKHNERTYFYGVVDGQIGERGTLTVGYSHQKADTDGNMWGALVFSYKDGTQAEFPRSSSTTQDWTYWNTEHQTAFAEFTYALTDAWDAKLTYNYRSYDDVSQLFYVLTNWEDPGLNPDNTGLLPWPGSWPTEDESNLIDLTLNGDFDAWGRTHEAILGLSYSRSQGTQFTRPVLDSDPAWAAILPAFPYAGDVVPEPVWQPTIVDSTMNQRLKRAYGATRLELSDRLTAIGGFNWAEYHREGMPSGGGRFDQTESELSPYAGVTYRITDSLLAYASYSDIYQPQDQDDFDGNYLDPSKGVNYEVGVKADWFEKRLLTTLALFTAEQENLATYGGTNPETQQYYYVGMDVESKGIEVEATGRPNEYVDLVFGFTALKLEDPQGAEIYTWVPRRTLNFSLASKLPSFPELQFGLNGRWQSDIWTVDSTNGGVIRQDSYATLNAFAAWDITANAYVRVNADNITDEKYIGSLYQVGFYAAPANYSVTVGYKF